MKIRSGPSVDVLARGPWFEIQRVENLAEVTIYGEIGFEVSAQDFIEQFDAFNSGEDVVIHLNSVGGQVFEGLAIYNRLLRHTGHVTVIVEGLAASMASIIAMAADRVEMYEASLFMIHNPAGGAWGDAEDMRKAAQTLDQVKDVLISAYERRTAVGRPQIVAWMDAETWFTPAEAVAAGFVDSIIEQEIDIAACVRNFDLSIFDHAPQGLGKTGVKTPQQTAASAAQPTETTMDKQSPADTNKPADNVVNIDDIKASAREDERKRISEIRATFKRYIEDDDIAALMTECIDKDRSVDESNRLLLKALAKQDDPVPVGGGHVQVVEDSRDKFVKGATAAILARAGVVKDDQSNEFRSYSLFDMARQSLQFRGVATGSMDRLSIVGEAFSHGTDDFDSVLANVAFKSMMMGYEEQVEVYPNLCRVVPLTDFKMAKLTGMGSFSDLDEVGEFGEYKHGTTADFGENAQLTTYGKLFAITRQAIINDDLNAFTGVPRMMGRAARRKIGDLVAALVAGTGHTLDTDGLALFDAGHVNTGSAAPSTATMEAMRTAMATQTDISGNTINVSPSILWVPYALYSAASQVVNSETEIAANQNNSRRPNTARGIVRAIYPDARLDTEDAAAWYGLADPQSYPALALGLLNGQDAPYLEEQQQFTRDGVTFKVRIDAVAEAVDFRTIYRGNNT